MASTARLSVTFAGQVVPDPPITGSPVRGVQGFILDFTSAGGNPLYVTEVASGADESYDLADLSLQTVAGKASQTDAKGWMLYVIPDGTGAAITGGAVLTVGGNDPVTIKSGGLFSYFPNNGTTLTDSVLVDLTTATGIKAVLLAAA